MVRDLDLVNPTVMRPRQSSVSSVGEPSGKNRPLRRLSDHSYCSSAPCRVSNGLHSKCPREIFLNGRAVKVVLVVRGCCHHEKTIRKSSVSGETV